MKKTEKIKQAEVVSKQGSVKKIILIVAPVIFIIMTLFVALYFYNQYNQTQKLLKNPAEAAKLQTKELLIKIGQLIDLPKEEEPTIVTVSDKKKLQNQPFFAKAENGDKVLLYTKAKKALLYRPATNKLIEVAPLNVNDSTSVKANNQATQNSSPTPAQVVKLAIYNGTKTSGLAGATETQLLAKFSNITVVAKSNANGDYSTTLVVDLKGTNSLLVNQLVADLGGIKGSLPGGETKPDADVLIILGGK